MKKADWSSSFESIDTMKFLSFDGHEIVLCHYPMMCWPHSNRGSYLVYMVVIIGISIYNCFHFAIM
jgi:calcineurin-like phosphoesterase family protein